MSIMYCENCQKHIDTDFNAEHFDECLDYQCDNFDEFVEKNKLTDLDEALEMWNEEIANYEDHDSDY